MVGSPLSRTPAWPHCFCIATNISTCGQAFFPLKRCPFQKITYNTFMKIWEKLRKCFQLLNTECGKKKGGGVLDSWLHG